VGQIVLALGVAAIVAFVGKAVLHMPMSAQLATLALCGLTVGSAGLALYGLLQALLGADTHVLAAQTTRTKGQ
jgi:hypothetical protein